MSIEDEENFNPLVEKIIIGVIATIGISFATLLLYLIVRGFMAVFL